MKSRYKVTIQGIVQGVGFRPFVYQQALARRLTGYVTNTSHGVDLEVEGEQADLDDFIRILHQDPPPLSRITSLQVQALPVQGHLGFTIRISQAQETRSALISPDVAVCPDCLRELRDPQDRRYRYPFINCTNCGPRYTIIKDIPYDRAKTTMAAFTLCAGVLRRIPRSPEPAFSRPAQCLLDLRSPGVPPGRSGPFHRI